MVVHEFEGLEELLGEGVRVVGREAFVVVLLGDVIQGGTQSFEDEAVMAAVVETLDVSDDVVLVLGVQLAEVLDDGLLCLGRVYVLLHWLYYLTLQRDTFIA